MALQHVQVDRSDGRFGLLRDTHLPSLGVPGMTKGGMESVEVFTTEGKGRGLKAQKEFLPGDVIFAEPAYAAVVFDR